MTKRSHSKISVASYGEFLRELGSEVNTNKRFKHIQCGEGRQARTEGNVFTREDDAITV